MKKITDQKKCARFWNTTKFQRYKYEGELGTGAVFADKCGRGRSYGLALDEERVFDGEDPFWKLSFTEFCEMQLSGELVFEEEFD